MTRILVAEQFSHSLQRGKNMESILGVLPQQTDDELDELIDGDFEHETDEDREDRLSEEYADIWYD